MLNNTDSVLKKGEVEEAIQDYEALFAGARTEVRQPQHSRWLAEAAISMLCARMVHPLALCDEGCVC